jgi:hypothetical protein
MGEELEIEWDDSKPKVKISEIMCYECGKQRGRYWFEKGDKKYPVCHNCVKKYRYLSYTQRTCDYCSMKFTWYPHMKKLYGHFVCSRCLSGIRLGKIRVDEGNKKVKCLRGKIDNIFVED